MIAGFTLFGPGLDKSTYIDAFLSAFYCRIQYTKQGATDDFIVGAEPYWIMCMFISSKGKLWKWPDSPPIQFENMSLFQTDVLINE